MGTQGLSCVIPATNLYSAAEWRAHPLWLCGRLQCSGAMFFLERPYGSWENAGVPVRLGHRRHWGGSVLGCGQGAGVWLGEAVARAVSFALRADRTGEQHAARACRSGLSQCPGRFLRQRWTGQASGWMVSIYAWQLKVAVNAK